MKKKKRVKLFMADMIHSDPVKKHPFFFIPALLDQKQLLFHDTEYMLHSYPMQKTPVFFHARHISFSPSEKAPGFADSTNNKKKRIL